MLPLKNIKQFTPAFQYISVLFSFTDLPRDKTFCIVTNISLKLVPKGPIDNNPALV